MRVCDRCKSESPKNCVFSLLGADTPTVGLGCANYFTKKPELCDSCINLLKVTLQNLYENFLHPVQERKVQQ